MTSIGRRIAEARKSAGLSQGALAKMLGVSNSLISAIERDIAHPSIENFIRIGEITKFSLDWLATGLMPAQSVTGKSFDRVTLERLLDQSTDQEFRELAAFLRVRLENKKNS